MNNAIEIRELSKSYKDFQLDRLSLTLPSGCILGLIGENGAGKSTTIKLLLGMVQADSGSARVLGVDTHDDLCCIKEDIGVVLDEPGLAHNLTIKQVDKIMGHIYRNWSHEEFFSLSRRLDLPENKPYGDFSRGTKMKLGLAIALAHKPKLLLLDEATSGLDPVVRDDVTDLLLDFTREEDHSILISSHIVSDLEKVCDYIAFLHKGKLILMEEKDVLLTEYGLLQCRLDDVEAIDPDAIIGRRDTPYGCQMIVRRSAVPAGMDLGNITLEELFVFMAKEDKQWKDC